MIGLITLNSNFTELATSLCNEALLKTETDFALHRQIWLEAFEKHFCEVCANVVQMQSESTISAISYLEYTILNTNFLNRQYVAEIYVYGDDGYLDKNQRMIGEYDVSFLFVHFDELWNNLLGKRKLYIGKVSSQDIMSFMVQALPDFCSYLTNIIRFAIVDCVDEKPFIEIVKNDEFEVCVGDYMAITDPVFTLKKNKNADELANWFSERLEYDYIFEDCSGLDFTGRDFSCTVFRYVQFRKALLNHANLCNCELVGAIFYNAQLENCNLSKSSIYEADFSYANLKNANLTDVYGKIGIIDKMLWMDVGFLPVSFRNADLTGADLSWSDLTGADFSGANLTDTNFTDTILDNAIFSDGDLPLTEDQKSKIIINRGD